MSVPSFDYGGSGQPLHFLHANGYPPECYQPLFEHLKTQYRVFGMKLRPLWPAADRNEIASWRPFSDDLLRFLSSIGPDSVIGMGHSIGGIVTLRAALREPARFRAIVLLDPVLFHPARLILWNFVKALGLGRRLHPKISGALKRRRNFDDLETVFRGYRKRDVFRYMSDDSLRAYIRGITRPTADGRYELVFSPEWESHIYYTGLQDFDIWRNLDKLKVPALIVRGDESDTFFEAAGRLAARKQPKLRVEALGKSTHLLPLEHPKEVFEIAQSFLKEYL